MQKAKWKKYGIVLAVYIFLAILFQLIGGVQLKEIERADTGTTSKGVIPEFTEGQVVEQIFTAGADSLRQVGFMVATYARENSGSLELTIESANDQHKKQLMFLKWKIIRNTSGYLTALYRGIEGRIWFCVWSLSAKRDKQ